MKVNKNSSVYILTYATVMVVVVAAVLAVAAMVLQPIQDENIAVETKGALLASVGVEVPTAQVEAAYDEYITEIAVTASDGEELPLYESTAGGKTLYIIPVRGSGLWGPVWGYVALESDWDTIAGVVFDHQGETPGLGAEIVAPNFTGQFVGKKIFEGSQLVGITVLKGSGASRGNDHAVDAISGGTITSRAVQNMILDCLGEYLPYIERQREAASSDADGGEGADGEEDEAGENGETENTTENGIVEE